MSVAALLKNRYVSYEGLFTGTMYVLVVVTFLNQSILQVDIGFFTLFLYRLVLMVAAFFFVVTLAKEKKLADYWDQVNAKGVLLFLMLWIGYGVVSLLWARSFMDGIKYLFLLGLGILFVFLAVFTFTKVTRLYGFYAIWMIMTIILLMVGLINHYGHIQLPTSTLYGASEHKLGYPTAVFYNQNDFATFLTISFFFYLAAAKNSKHMWIKTSCLFLGGLCIYIISLTESRASLLAVVVGLAGYTFILLPALYKKVIIGVGLVGLGLALVMFVNMPASGDDFDSSSSNVVRVNLLKTTFHYVLDTFGFGVGVGNLPFYLEHEPVYDTNAVFEVHNWLAEIIGNFGVLVLLGYLTMYGYLFLSLYKIYREREQHRALFEALMTALIAFLVASISPSSVSNLYFHWVFLGFVIATVSVFKMKEQQQIHDKPY
ncbi:teichuronic acid biosynthesis protein TuaE [Mesobacillus maritimus]|uniref:teichuronic acid biosynthesis protein TuaE n=1 Tax=Mesobacillus maritimus TaxID=1643336 RepID=UPI003850D71F